MRRCLYTYSSWGTTLTCDRQADGRTDRQTLGHNIYRASIVSRVKIQTEATDDDFMWWKLILLTSGQIKKSSEGRHRGAEGAETSTPKASRLCQRRGVEAPQAPKGCSPPQ